MENLYHYTDLNAFLNIIQNKKIWLTGAHNLNDYQEINWTHNKVFLHLEQLKKSTAPSKIYQLQDYLNNNKAMGIYYICSLSEKPDLLSQWRAYGQNGAGVSIGIKRTSLPDFDIPKMTAAMPGNLTLQRIFYDESIQDNLIKEIINDALASDADLKLSHAAANLHNLSSIFKNPAFSEEAEWRIINTVLVLANRLNYQSLTPIRISTSKYRVSGSKLINYFEYDFNKLNAQEIFSEIVLGPKSEISNLDLRLFLAENGLENIKITYSKASYR